MYPHDFLSQIAQQVFDLIESNAVDLEDKIEDAENDLARTQFAELGDFPPPASVYASPAGFGVPRTSTPRPMEEWGSLAPTPTLPPEQSIPAPLSAAPSLVGGLPLNSSMKRPASAPAIRVMLKKPKDPGAPDSSAPDTSAPMNE